MTLQTVLSNFLIPYQQQHHLNAVQFKAIRHISQCRTAALGGQWVKCSECDFEQLRFHSCRDRHCPKCQQQATDQWCEAQLTKILPVSYYHVVFTLPHELNGWVSWHGEVIYRCLFAAVWHTLKTFGADKKRLNGELGMIAILHTWGQNLCRHVHLHCLIPGGALSHDQAQWHEAKSNYLFPVRALSRHFRGTMVSTLRRAYNQRDLPRLDPADVNQRLQELMAKQWVVYSKAHIKKPETVVRYLGRYTRKIAISESRMQSVDPDQVVFSYKDYRDGKNKSLSLPGVEFLRRFLLHILPTGFVRIRHYGFLSNRTITRKLEVIRRCLQCQESKQEKETAEVIAKDCLCPQCRKGRLVVRHEIPARPIYGR